MQNKRAVLLIYNAFAGFGRRPVGDFSYCLFDKNGESNPDWHFDVTVGDNSNYPGVAFYKNLVTQGNRVVATAASIKWDALVAALKAKLFNVLVTDAFTAKRLLLS